jgi:hypothetical protein
VAGRTRQIALSPVTPCFLIRGYERVGDTRSVHLQGRIMMIRRSGYAAMLLVRRNTFLYTLAEILFYVNPEVGGLPKRRYLNTPHDAQKRASRCRGHEDGFGFPLVAELGGLQA